MKKLILTIASVLLFSSAVLATDNSSDNNTLHTFSSGETISSSKMNQNFGFVNNYVVKSNGNKIGNLLGISGSQITLLNSKSFITQINSLGEISENSFAYYKNINCSGDKYTMAGSFLPGTVFKHSDNLYYIEKDSTFSYSIYYKQEPWGCSESPAEYLVKIIQNDPNITGVSGDYSFPITITK